MDTTNLELIEVLKNIASSLRDIAKSLESVEGALQGLEQCVDTHAWSTPVVRIGRVE
jgi:hypothetical protein